MWRVWYLKHRVREILENKDGVGVVEIILILVVLISLVVIFKSQLTSLVETIFEKITSESSGGSHSVFKSGIYFTYFICRSNAGKCLFTECKKLQKSRYDTGGGKYICRVSEGTLGSLRNFCAGRKL